MQKQVLGPTSKSQALPVIPSAKAENSKQVEEEFIENLKKQIYFMEMELKLMKEREKEIQKSGGFTQLFNDERDPSTHIQQLKTKYSNMRVKMADEVEGLNQKQREVSALNVSLKAKLEALQKLEKAAFEKYSNYENKSSNKINNIQNNFGQKNQERNELEANNRMKVNQLAQEIQKNKELEYQITSEQKMNELTEKEFQAELDLIENMTKEKTNSYEDYLKKINVANSKCTEEPYFKGEMEKNKDFKEKIKDLERKAIDVKMQAEGLEIVNNFLIEKKKALAEERKKLVESNIELKHEIESKNQINEIRIQKKVKEINSEEIVNLNEHLEETNNKIKELEEKIQKEIEKIKRFSNEIIRANIEIKQGEEKKKQVAASIEEKEKQLDDLKAKREELMRTNDELKTKIGKEKTINELVRNRHKKLAEEYAAMSSKLEFMNKNYDTTSNLKKLKMEDLENLTQTNNQVNDTINAFVNKVGTFKKKNASNMIDFDN
ncbi:MAG: hypothetical protein MJ252_14845 [archaeon]|nr:hypothetical protein [archaeon]